MDGVQVFVLKGIEMTIVSRPGAVLGAVYHMCGSIAFLATDGRLSLGCLGLIRSVKAVGTSLDTRVYSQF